MLGVIPIVMLPCNDTDIPLLWRTYRRYDATWDYEAARNGLLGAMGLSLPSAPTPTRAKEGRRFRPIRLVAINPVPEGFLSNPYEMPDPYLLQQVYGDSQLGLALSQWPVAYLRKAVETVEERNPGKRSLSHSRKSIMIAFIVETLVG